MLPPGRPHAVLTPEISMVAGSHFYVWAGIRATIYSIYDTCILGNLTNNEHAESWEILRHMGIDFANTLEQRLRNEDPGLEKNCM
jgi:hypothetical protein